MGPTWSWRCGPLAGPSFPIPTRACRRRESGQVDSLNFNKRNNLLQGILANKIARLNYKKENYYSLNILNGNLKILATNRHGYLCISCYYRVLQLIIFVIKKQTN